MQLVALGRAASDPGHGAGAARAPTGLCSPFAGRRSLAPIHGGLHQASGDPDQVQPSPARPLPCCCRRLCTVLRWVWLGRRQTQHSSLTCCARLGPQPHAARRGRCLPPPSRRVCRLAPDANGAGLASAFADSAQQGFSFPVTPSSEAQPAADAVFGTWPSFKKKRRVRALGKAAAAAVGVALELRFRGAAAPSTCWPDAPGRLCLQAHLLVATMSTPLLLMLSPASKEPGSSRACSDET